MKWNEVKIACLLEISSINNISILIITFIVASICVNTSLLPSHVICYGILEEILGKTKLIKKKYKFTLIFWIFIYKIYVTTCMNVYEGSFK